ncbi:MAG: hypothetical protein EXX96DRAFT_651089 [Benjaminiella poitrasii]|nr:MAG: hypothetical protein EXX96DRAFT_651089 [Benjaminiella poitrasii]
MNESRTSEQSVILSEEQTEEVYFAFHQPIQLKDASLRTRILYSQKKFLQTWKPLSLISTDTQRSFAQHTTAATELYEELKYIAEFTNNDNNPQYKPQYKPQELDDWQFLRLRMQHLQSFKVLQEETSLEETSLREENHPSIELTPEATFVNSMEIDFVLDKASISPFLTRNNPPSLAIVRYQGGLPKPAEFNTYLKEVAPSRDLIGERDNRGFTCASHRLPVKLHYNPTADEKALQEFKFVGTMPPFQNKRHSCITINNRKEQLNMQDRPEGRVHDGDVIFRFLQIPNIQA